MNGEFLGCGTCSYSCESCGVLLSTSFSGLPSLTTTTCSIAINRTLTRCINCTIPSNSTTINTTCNDVVNQRESILTSQVSSSFSEVVDVVLRPPVEQSSGAEVDVKLAALAMLPATVRGLSLPCKNWDIHPRFSELCPTKLIAFAHSCKFISLDLYRNNIGDAGVEQFNIP